MHQKLSTLAFIFFTMLAIAAVTTVLPACGSNGENDDSRSQSIL